MQTGLHFENGQVYAYVISGQKTTEEEPAAYEGSWADYVREILDQDQNKNCSFGIITEYPTPMEIKEAEEISDKLEGSNAVKLYTKEEAILGMVRFQQNDLKRGRTAVYDYGSDGFIYYEVKEESGKVTVEKQNYTREMEKARTKGEKDLAFSAIIRKTLGRGVTAAVYLCGEGFEGQWFRQSTRILCRGRRVFMSSHLFACGAAYMAGKEAGITSDDAFIITDQMTVCQIGLVLHHHGRDVFYPLLPEGKPWFEAKGEIEIFVSGITKIIFEFRNKEGRKMASVCMPLTGLKRNRDIVYKLKMRGEYLSADRCKIKVSDEGFGSIRPSSHQVWQQIIRLERSESNE
ncbi:MAG TPA: hypothetical protein H9754_10845 [Candidatus Anaerostipes avistercoris]|uniref:DUF5716 domain-containing protein n=1 Tax=Candidatus Anaerostipes avistercoris TaxID=2838462 RepID=A0A9D2PHT2_9FIRM|nr:DUF5716 family protein [uncultured Anaerostipes sp.]HJC51040.1 hypothetical protein [Candidatus Anaerostipes avistercoris]